jgi:hypothetical protein
MENRNHIIPSHCDFVFFSAVAKQEKKLEFTPALPEDDSFKKISWLMAGCRWMA